MSFYRNKHVVVTGGLGFIGSNLALRLVAEGARVTAIDAAVPGCGANPHNLADAAVRVLPRNIADPWIGNALKKADVVFNLAGEVSHIHSMLYPMRDCEINTTSQMEFLNTLAGVQPGVRVVYASTRQIYGAPASLPADEGLPVAATDFNGVHKFAAEQYHHLLTRLGRLDAIVLRLTNVYGPRMAIGLGCQGFLPGFTARAVRKQALEVYGSGLQLRDPLYVDDACEAFLRAGEVTQAPQRCFNIGTPQATSLLKIAEVFSKQAELPAPRRRPFPEDRKAIDIGSYYTSTVAVEAGLGWIARVGLWEGVQRTLEYHGQHKASYLRGGQSCPLGHAGGSARAS